MPKKREDIDKIIDEVESLHSHEHEHHHHHHGSIDETLSVIELLIDSLSAQIKNLESALEGQARDVARLYRVVAHIVEALASKSDEERAAALRRALDELRD